MDKKPLKVQPVTAVSQRIRNARAFVILFRILLKERGQATPEELGFTENDMMRWGMEGAAPEAVYDRLVAENRLTPIAEKSAFKFYSSTIRRLG